MLAANKSGCNNPGKLLAVKFPCLPEPYPLYFLVRALLEGRARISTPGQKNQLDTLYFAVTTPNLYEKYLTFIVLRLRFRLHQGWPSKRRHYVLRHHSWSSCQVVETCARYYVGGRTRCHQFPYRADRLLRIHRLAPQKHWVGRQSECRACLCLSARHPLDRVGLRLEERQAGVARVLQKIFVFQNIVLENKIFLLTHLLCHMPIRQALPLVQGNGQGHKSLINRAEILVRD